MENYYIDLIWAYSVDIEIPRLLYAPMCSGLEKGDVVLGDDGGKYEVENKQCVNIEDKEYRFILDVTRTKKPIRITTKIVTSKQEFDYTRYEGANIWAEI